MANLRAEMHKNSHKTRKLARPLTKSNVHRLNNIHSFSRAKGKLNNSAEIAYLGAQEMLMATSEEMKKRSDKAMDKMELYVKKQPLKALGWAALSGAFLALLVRR